MVVLTTEKLFYEKKIKRIITQVTYGGITQRDTVLRMGSSQFRGSGEELSLKTGFTGREDNLKTRWKEGRFKTKCWVEER